MLEPAGEFWLYDPSNIWIIMDSYSLDDEGEAAVLEEEPAYGSAQGVAYCRALYDENALDGGFCCQTTAMIVGGLALQINELNHAWGVYAQEGEVTIEYYGEDYPVLWGAEHFASADNGIAASILAVTATIMAFTQ